jgi:hypothetical protein
MNRAPNNGISETINEVNDMDVVVGIFALVIAVGCAIAIVVASRRESSPENGS